MEDKLKKAKKLATYLFPYKGQPIDTFWNDLTFEQRFWAFNVLHQIS